MTTELVIGSVSLVALSTCFEQALRAYDFFLAASKTASHDFHRIATRILYERYRFELYGEYMELSGDTGDVTRLRSHSSRDQDFITSTIKEIDSLLADSERLLKRYGITVSSGAEDIEMNPPRSRALAFRQQSPSAISPVQAQRTKLGTSQRLRWTWTDNAKAEKLQRDLRDLNDQLWGVLSPQNASALRNGMPSFVLPGLTDGDTLREIQEQASQDQQQHPLGDCAGLRRSINMPSAQVVQSVQWKQVMLPKTGVKVSEVSVGRNSQIHVGVFERTQGLEHVLIEYKYIHPGLKPGDSALVKTRLHQLAYTLSQKVSSELCLFQYAGFFEASSNPLKYALVYKLPEVGIQQKPNVVSLASILCEENSYYRCTLGDRFRLAAMLANAVMQIHAAGWYHKNLRPENVIFFQTDSGRPRLDSPRLVGFGSARPSDVTETSLLSEQRSDNVDWHRHPKYQASRRDARFEKRYDYFSLGVMLASIGLWEESNAVVKKFCARNPSEVKNAGAWASFLCTRVEDNLGSSCGRIYRDAVLRCLRGESGVGASEQSPDETDSQRWFLFQVVQQLQRCCA